MKLKRSLLLYCSILALFMGGGFAWGFVTHQKGIFPHKILISLARKTGHVTPNLHHVTSKSEDLRKKLLALPYIDGSFDLKSDSEGTLVKKDGKTFEGLNFYCSRTGDRALLVDMEGALVHQWVFPSYRWDYVDLLPNGDVLATKGGKKLVRVDKNSRILWSYEAHLHHNFAVVETGDIYAQIAESRVIEAVHPTVKTRDDMIVVLSKDGAVKETFSVVRLLLDSPYEFLLPSVSHLNFDAEIKDQGDVALDVLHVNSIQIFDGQLASKSDLFAKGNFLISARNINAIFIVDGKSREVLWLWGPTNLTFQHRPNLLPNGHILVFNNGKEFSQIIELDPLSREIAWLYEDPGEFFSKSQGSQQRLPNGNTLITESNTGYAFEVTEAGEVVWEFANPDIDAEGVRSSIWRMARFHRSELSFLGEQE